MKRFFHYLILIPMVALLVFMIILLTTHSKEVQAVLDTVAESESVSWEETAQIKETILISETETEVGLEIPKDAWYLRLVNENNPLPDDYAPTLSEVYEGYEFDSRAAEYLIAMIEAGNREGLQLKICSAYRTVEKQSVLFKEQIAQQRADGLSEAEAVSEAKRAVAYPGRSEHNLGLAADIVAKNYQMLDDGFADTEEAIWLKEHCAEYGFILRYPKDKTEITQVIYEPWHFRYVGVEAATYIMENDLCLEEYLDLAE